MGGRNEWNKDNRESKTQRQRFWESEWKLGAPFEKSLPSPPPLSLPAQGRPLHVLGPFVSYYLPGDVAAQAAKGEQQRCQHGLGASDKSGPSGDQKLAVGSRLDEL